MEGVHVLGAEDLKKLNPEKSVVVITCNYYDEIKAQLEDCGIKYIFYYVLLQEKVMNRSYGFFGDYRSWEEAERNSTGYDAECIFNKVKNSTEMALRGEALFERDSIAFHEEDYNYKLLAALLYIAKMENGLSVIDFGGSLGSTYHQNKKIFHQIGNVDWHIVEQDHYVQYGKKCNGGFHYEIEECSMEPVNCL